MRVLGFAILFACLVGVVWFAGSERPMPEPDELVKPGPTDPDAPEEHTTTESGLQYRILRKSDGTKPGPTDRVRVHYRGRLRSGRIFDNTYADGDSIAFKLDNVIAGWTEGLQLIGEGGMIELIVPPHLGYGDKASGGGIPANTTMFFLIELVEITNEPPEQKIVERVGPGPIDEDAPEEYTETESGFKFRVLRKSEGHKPGPYDVVTLHMQSWAEGQIAPIYDSYASKWPSRSCVTTVMPELALALGHISEGGMIECLMPPDLRPALKNTKSDFVVAEGETIRQIAELMKIERLFSTPVTDEDVPDEFQVTDSGLKYRILHQTDETPPKLNDQVTVNYIGWMDNGVEFDGTHLGGRPSTFPLSSAIIKGWREGLQLIGRGGIIELEVPPQLGYGLFGDPPIIPADATLRFAIEILEIN